MRRNEDAGSVDGTLEFDWSDALLVSGVTSRLDRVLHLSEFCNTALYFKTVVLKPPSRSTSKSRLRKD